MSLSDQLINEIQALSGHVYAPAVTVSVTDPALLELQADVSAVDMLSCTLQELRLNVQTLNNSGLDTLKEWAEALCNRVTYLLENLGPLEFDQNGTQVLIRSTPPNQQPDGTKFYEILLQSRSGGQFVLRRFCSEQGTTGRDLVDMHLTHEVLARLVDDLCDTIPGP